MADPFLQAHPEDWRAKNLADLIAWVWYHRTMDAADEARGSHPDRLERHRWSRTMRAARGIAQRCEQPHDAIDTSERSRIEGWTAERLEASLPGYTAFAAEADRALPGSAGPSPLRRLY